MSFKDLVPWNRHKGDVSRQGDGANGVEPASAFSNDIEDVFDHFVRDFFQNDLLTASASPDVFPRIDVSETDDVVEVRAELPGVEEDDLDVSVTAGALTVRGEKKSNHEEKGRDYLKREQSYGVFHRVVRLPDHLDADKVSARFKNGVLTVTLPKTEASRRRRRKITVQAV